MTNKTQTLENFQVIRDGELDPSFVRKQRVEAIVGHTARLGQVVVSKLGQYASEIVTPAYLEYKDAQLGTDLRGEYFARKRELATAALRGEVGL